jgi:hypothetical protein
MWIEFPIRNADGSIRDITLLREDPEGYDIGKNAVEAVSQWRFEPATFEDKPVAVVLNKTIEVRKNPSP